MIVIPISMNGALIVMALAIAILSMAIDLAVRLRITEDRGEIHG